jgi:beta-galactosidase/beta-glucuronidase
VHPLRGRSLTPELCRRDAELFRAANANLVRTSHYPPSEEFLDAWISSSRRTTVP